MSERKEKYGDEQLRQSEKEAKEKVAEYMKQRNERLKELARPKPGSDTEDFFEKDDRKDDNKRQEDSDREGN